MHNNPLKILFVVSEATPFATTGSLGDVAGSLPLAIASLGHDIRVVVPKYKKIDNIYSEQMEYVTDYAVNLDWRKQTAIVRKMNMTGYADCYVPWYFIDNAYYFDRTQFYSHHDDAERFAFFNKAVLEMLPKIDFQPDIIHCSDWQTGPICILLKQIYQNSTWYKDIQTIFSIHNLHYQGNFAKDTLSLLGLDETVFHPDGLEFFGNVSYLKAGIVYCDLLTTVSETYAKEIQMPEYGNGMDGVIRKRQQNLYGILNGINYEFYNPQTDSWIYENYNVQERHKKQSNKKQFQREMDLPIKEVPMVGMISHLADQKGLDLIEESIEDMMKLDLQLIIMGTGDPFYEDMLRNMQNRYPDKLRIMIVFQTELAQKIYAASDLYLMPSKFEACGLEQMRSLRYGTIPVVRETGGLADTIKNFDSATLEGNGFIFRDYNSKAMIDVLKRAVKIYMSDPEIWDCLIEKGMKENYSWEKSAQRYVEIYQKLKNL